jgi:membrane-bound lytic murein transglycosylase A
MRVRLGFPHTWFRALSAALLVVLASCMPPQPPMPQAGPLRLTALSFAELAGWEAADPRPALAGFQRSCTKLSALADTAPLGASPYAGTAADWRPACTEAATLQPTDAAAARGFFERQFAPYRVSRGDDAQGLFTGYYEPQLKGSRTRHAPYLTPLYGMPGDMVTADLGLFREGLRGQRLTGRVEQNRFVPYYTRADIVKNGLPRAQALVYVDDPVDAFFLQVQGSGRVVLDDGTIVRAAYAGQNGHPYTAVGAVLIQMGEVKREEVSMQSIRAWLAANPDRADVLLDRNASYVFFSLQPLGDPALGANGAEGVPLTPGASLAVDASVHPLGVPLWLDTNAPAPDPAQPDVRLQRLVVAQDTGGAIRGAVRGDVYWGFGPEAGNIAGRMRGMGSLTALLPKGVAARLGPRAEFPGAGV